MTHDDPTLPALLARVEELTARLDAQEAELARLRPTAAAAPAAGAAREAKDARLSRRRMLTIAGATAAAAGVGVLGRPGVAAAVDGQAVVLGESTNNASTTTAIFAGSSLPTLSLASGANGSPLRLVPTAGSEGVPSGPGQIGEVYMTDDGFLFVRGASSGSQADWSLLNTLDTLFTFPTPDRAYDSRDRSSAAGKVGLFAARETRVIDLAAAGAVFPGAVGAVINVTITETRGGGGYVSVYSAAATIPAPNFSLLNWYGPNQTVANSAEFAVDENGRIKVFADNPTHVVIDVIGERYLV